MRLTNISRRRTATGSVWNCNSMSVGIVQVTHKNIIMKRFISFSGGVESTTMCILYGKGATAIWCDTGAEHQEMYERIDDCESKLKEIHNGDFELIRVKAKVKVKGVFVDNLIDAIIGWMFMPTTFMRWCTGKFKIVPIDEFLSKQGECELLIGLNSDEEKREGNWGLQSNVNYIYPLQDDDLTRDDCKVILAEHGLLPDFPVYMSRGGVFHVYLQVKKRI